MLWNFTIFVNFFSSPFIEFWQKFPKMMGKWPQCIILVMCDCVILLPRLYSYLSDLSPQDRSLLFSFLSIGYLGKIQLAWLKCESWQSCHVKNNMPQCPLFQNSKIGELWINWKTTVSDAKLYFYFKVCTQNNILPRNTIIVCLLKLINV